MPNRTHMSPSFPPHLVITMGHHGRACSSCSSRVLHVVGRRLGRIGDRQTNGRAGCLNHKCKNQKSGYASLNYHDGHCGQYAEKNGFDKKTRTWEWSLSSSTMTLSSHHATPMSLVLVFLRSVVYYMILYITSLATITPVCCIHTMPSSRNTYPPSAPAHNFPSLI